MSTAPNSIHRILSIAVIGALTASISAGCSHHHHHKGTTQSADAEQINAPTQSSFTLTPIVVPTERHPVKEGLAPLAYMVESDGGVRVEDMTTGLLVAQTIAARQSIVSVDSKRGVNVNNENIAKGPLEPTHRYAIYFNPGGLNPENQVIQGTLRNDPSALHLHDKSEAPATMPTGPAGFSSEPSRP